MGRFGLLHSHPGHRARQLRWVLPLAAVLLLAVAATLAIQYRVSSQAIGSEFFHAHKTIRHTGELLARGTLIGGAVLVVLVLAVTLWALRVTHRIVRPVHTLHRTLDALVAGDLGVRVELDRTDEFGEVAEALNRLVDEFATALGKVHALVDRIVAASPEGPHRVLVEELDRRMEFFRLEPRHTIRERNG
jgi:methyl-accepting chemotaxis protein